VDTLRVPRKPVNGISLFFYLVVLNIKSRMAYALDFWMELGLVALFRVIGLLVVTIIFTRVALIKDWNVFEMIFLFGFASLSIGGFRLFINGLYSFTFLVQNGDFDQALTKPRHPLIMVAPMESNITGLGDLVVGLALVLYTSGKLHLPWTPARVGLFVLFVVVGNIINSSFILIQSSASFWLTRFAGSYDVSGYLRDFCQYPLTIYGNGLRFFLTYIVPIGFTSFYPAAYFLGKGIPIVWLFISVPIAGAGLLLAALLLFRIGLGNYNSTGS
jgi:ABC-2 type transport system permease protein